MLLYGETRFEDPITVWMYVTWPGDKYYFFEGASPADEAGPSTSTEEDFNRVGWVVKRWLNIKHGFIFLVISFQFV